MKKLYFIRHGESTMNTDKIWGSRSPAPLTELGRKQAKAAARKIQELELQLDLIVSSPLKRAHETAEIIAQEINYPVKEIVFEDLLMERSYGELEGTVVDDFFKSHEYEDLDRVKGAETVEYLQKRAEKAYEYLTTLPADTILVVSHSAFGRALKRVIHQQPYLHEYTEHTSIPHADIVCWIEG